MQSVYKRETLEIKEKLDAFSPTICLAKWLWVSLNLPAGLTQSCYHPPVQKIPLDELKNDVSALHNTKHKKQMRRLMLEGERPIECSYCWKIEDSEGDYLSDRYYRSGEWWAKDLLDDIINSSYNDNVNPTYVEVNFNQACNFKCSYCSPHLSTSWEKEILQHGEYKLVHKRGHNSIYWLNKKGIMPIKGDNPYIKAFWEWWPDLYKTLRTFRMTGGEPLIDYNTFKILDYIIDHPNKNLEISITTNACPIKQKTWDNFMDKVDTLINLNWKVLCIQKQNKQRYVINKDLYRTQQLEDLDIIDHENISIEEAKSLGFTFDNEDLWYKQEPENVNNHYSFVYDVEAPALEHIMLFVSLDSVGKQLEYSRFGANYKTILNNVKNFITKKGCKSVTFINTFNLLSLSKLKQYLQMILTLRKEFNTTRQKIWFDMPILETPKWLCINNCTEKEKQEIKECIKFMETNIETNFDRKHIGFKDYEIDKLQRNLEWIDDNSLEEYQRSINYANLYLFFNEYDRRRDVNFIKTFPELEYMFNQGKKIGESI